MLTVCSDLSFHAVDDFNNKKIYPRLKSLMAKDYFRYFQYQPTKKCPFWDSSSGRCASNYCQVVILSLGNNHSPLSVTVRSRIVPPRISLLGL